MSKFTAVELVEFYQAVVDGGVMEFNSPIRGGWVKTDRSPTVSSKLAMWRVTQAKDSAAKGASHES